MSARDAHPFLRIEIQVFHLPMLEETCQSNSVISKMPFFANYDNVVFPSFGVELEDFLAIHSVYQQPNQSVCSMEGIGVCHSHEGYANHTQANNDDLLAFRWRLWVLFGIFFFSTVASCGLLADRHAW